MAFIGAKPTNVPLTSADIQDGTVGLADLSASGTKSSSTFLRGDNTFASVSVNNGLELLATTTISSDASISFDSSLITDTYKTYKAVVENLQSANDSVYIYWQISSNNGSSYITSGYSRMIFYLDQTGSTGTAHGDENKPGFYLNGSGALGNTSREGLNSEITFFGLRSTATNKSTFHTTVFNPTDGNVMIDFGSFQYSSGTAMNNIKMLSSSGNLASGTVKFYGVK